MKKKFFLLLFVFCPLFSFFYAQGKSSKGQDCKIDVPRKTIDKRKFATTDVDYFMIQNKVNELVSVHLGKRKNKIFLFLKVLQDDVCFRSNEAIEVYFEDESYLPLRNDIDINCDGNFVNILDKKAQAKLLSRKITKIMIFTSEEDYEIVYADVDSDSFDNKLKCLQDFRVPTK